LRNAIPETEVLTTFREQAAAQVASPDGRPDEFCAAAQKEVLSGAHRLSQVCL
jgi:hypothetical protein